MLRVVKIEEKEEVGEVNKFIERYFPYKHWRKYQREIAEICYESLKNKQHVILEAPTGLGKTSAILSAVLPIAINEELKILWCCRTHQQIIGVLNEVSKIKQKEQKFIEPIGLWGRKQLCVNNSINILDESCFHHACGMLRRSFRCPYYRIEDSQWIVSNVKNIIYPNEAKKKFESYQFCP